MAGDIVVRAENIEIARGHRRQGRWLPQRLEMYFTQPKFQLPVRKRRRISVSVDGLFLRCATALLVGCAGASSAQTPTAVPPSSQATQAVSEEDQLRHLTLQRATDLLIANNLSVIAARFNVDILRAQRIAAGLKPRPATR